MRSSWRFEHLICMGTPLDRDCTHVERHGFHCGAEPYHACSEIDADGIWHPMTYFHPERFGRPPPALHSLEIFTFSERRVIALLVNGHNRESTAGQMGISRSTVQKHLSSITAKLGVNSALEICVWYYQTYYEPITHPMG
jgi:DNA-binding CsgD family transcriptional regulator